MVDLARLEDTLIPPLQLPQRDPGDLDDLTTEEGLGAICFAAGLISLLQLFFFGAFRREP
jgi:hypothetical protein